MILMAMGHPGCMVTFLFPFFFRHVNPVHIQRFYPSSWVGWVALLVLLPTVKETDYLACECCTWPGSGYEGRDMS